MAGDDVLTVGVGPRSRLVPASRVARFLQGERAIEPPYTISLSLPTTTVEPSRVQWTRVGWTAHGDRLVELPGAPRHVHLRVDLRGPWLAARPRRPGGAVRRRAARRRLGLEPHRGGGVAAALAVAARPCSRATADVSPSRSSPSSSRPCWPSRCGASRGWATRSRASGDLLIRQTLRDAAASAGESNRPTTTVGLAATIAELGRRLDADLWTYRGGRLAGTSAPVLAQLGLVDPLLAPPVYRALAFEDETEMTVDERTAGRPTRVGYRVVASGPARDQVVLAAPQLLDDETVRRQQEDLALVLILATLAGVIAAGALAGVTARTLARPVAALREAALAVGRGAAPPPLPADAPREFAPVLNAFERMVQDVRRSQAALEEARQRTAQVLANVATGVVAVDGELRVTIANPRAAELLGVALEPGTLVEAATAADWEPLWQVVRAFLARPAGQIVERELTIRGRDIRVQLAPLGASPTAASWPSTTRRRWPGRRGCWPGARWRGRSRTRSRTRSPRSGSASSTWSASGERGAAARRLRPHAGGHRPAHPGRDRPARHHRARLLALWRARPTSSRRSRPSISTRWDAKWCSSTRWATPVGRPAWC